MPGAGAVKPGGQSLHHRRGRDAAIGVTHQLRLTGLLGQGDVGFGQVREAPDRMSEVVHALPGADVRVEVDDSDGLLTPEDRVVRAQVPVADGLLVGAEPGRGGRVVESSDQRGGADDSSVGQPIGADTRHLAVDERQDLTSAVVVAERARSAGEANVSQMSQKRVHVR
jgi:hypothetical protein